MNKGQSLYCYVVDVSSSAVTVTMALAEKYWVIGIIICTVQAQSSIVSAESLQLYAI